MAWLNNFFSNLIGGNREFLLVWIDIENIPWYLNIPSVTETAKYLENFKFDSNTCELNSKQDNNKNVFHLESDV